MKEIRARVWENLEETIIQCLEIPNIKSTKPTKSEAISDITAQLQTYKESNGGIEIKLTLIESQEIIL